MGAFNLTKYRALDEVEPALTREDLVRIRGPELRPVPKPEPTKRSGAPRGHGSHYAWARGCRCAWCVTATKEYRVRQLEARRLREAKQ